MPRFPRRLPSPTRLLSRRRLRQPVPLIPFSLALGLTLVLAAAAAAGLIVLTLVGLGSPDLPQGSLGVTDLLEVVKISLAVVAGVGGVVALVVAYRKQRLAEAGEAREHTKLYAERFDKATDKLGSGAPAVRLAGVHALAALADDWDGGRQMCIDVLCAYLRMPPEPEPDAEHDPGAHGAWRAMREVRATIIRLIATHLRESAPIPWIGADLDFTGVVFDNDANFMGAEFSGGLVTFRDAEFSGGTVTFRGAEFSGGTVWFGGAEFSGGTVSFAGAEFSGGTVWFGGAELSDSAKFSGGTVSFDGADFSGGDVWFAGAEFSGGRVSFEGAKFSGGEIWFAGTELSNSAKFSGGTVSFAGAEFSSSDVWFARAEFSGGRVSFAGAEFSGGTVWFGGAEDGAVFSGGTVSFDGAEFSGGTVTFRSAEFSGGDVWFAGAVFSGGRVWFGGAVFSGGMVDFTRVADWSHPPIDLPAQAPGLDLPPQPASQAVAQSAEENTEQTKTEDGTGSPKPMP